MYKLLILAEEIYNELPHSLSDDFDLEVVQPIEAMIDHLEKASGWKAKLHVEDDERWEVL